MEIDSWIAALPKAELHLHLEGSAEPETLARLLPGLSLEEIRSHYRYRGFAEFLESFKWVARHLRTPEDYCEVARDLFSTLAKQNVRYAEVMLSVGVLLWKQQDAAETFEALAAVAEEAPLTIRWVFDAIRQFPVDAAEEVLELAIAYRDRGVVGFGIGGSEQLGPARHFRGVFADARRAGLRLTVHGGETTGPQSIWEALEGGAERIGHGIRAAEDLVLLRHLAEHRIPLEISISSNVLTGSVASLEAHPIRAIYDAGVPIILNTDDPAMFHTSLNREYQIAQDKFGFSEEELREISTNGFQFAFDRDAASSALNI
ncbi:MAG: adenosine deaminase [Bryobacterales bacterium]|nr:adenosine deaminase [Bryobacterales bacterium]